MITVFLDGDRSEAAKHLTTARHRHAGYKAQVSGHTRSIATRPKPGLRITYGFNPDSIRIRVKEDRPEFVRAVTGVVTYPDPYNEQAIGDVTIYRGGSPSTTRVAAGPTLTDEYVYGGTPYASGGRGPKRFTVHSDDVYMIRREAYNTEYFDAGSTWHFTEYQITEDRGETWWGFLVTASAINDVHFVGFDPTDGWARFILSQGGFFYENDALHNWSNVPLPSVLGSYLITWLHGTTCSFLNNYIWTVDTDSERYYSTDAGATWSADTGFPLPLLASPRFYLETATDASGGIVAVQTKNDGSALEVFTSTNYGQTWTSRGESSPGVQSVDTAYHNPVLEPLGKDTFLLTCYNATQDTINVFVIELTGGGSSITHYADPFSQGIPEALRGASSFRSTIVYDYRGPSSKIGVVLHDTSTEDYVIYTLRLSSTGNWLQSKTLNAWPQDTPTAPRDVWRTRDVDGKDFITQRPFVRV